MLDLDPKQKLQSWQPVYPSVLKSREAADAIHTKGYFTHGNIGEKRIEMLRDIYKRLHNFSEGSGGMFYSVYSRDLVYRKQVHEEIGKIMAPVYETIFNDYRSVLNSFIIKTTGPESEFALHQDSTGLDETKYTCVSVWIPLQRTDMGNGCMCILPYSQHMFSPYRSITIPPPFSAIAGTVREYLMPVELDAGDIFIFDNRLVHNSVANTSGHDRIAVMSGIFPSGADIITCYKESPGSSRVEIIKQDDSFLITFENFFHDCACKPEVGETIGFAEWPAENVTLDQFTSMCSRYGLEKVNNPAIVNTTTNQRIIGEPIA
jgi:hypothetical protein